jgi:phage baseplate assembly protein W
VFIVLWTKFELNSPVFIAIFAPTHRGLSLGINSISTEAVSGYEIGLRIRVASYRVEFSVIGSDPLPYAGARSADHWVTVVGC